MRFVPPSIACYVVFLFVYLSLIVLGNQLSDDENCYQLDEKTFMLNTLIFVWGSSKSIVIMVALFLRISAPSGDAPGPFICLTGPLNLLLIVFGVITLFSYVCGFTPSFVIAITLIVTSLMELIHVSYYIIKWIGYYRSHYELP